MTTTLRNILADDRHVLGYNSAPMLTWHGDDDDRPTGGETVHHNWTGLIGVTLDYRTHVAGNLATLDGATHVTVPVTTWGDYVGDDVQRSNCRSLQRDMPDTFVTVLGDYSSEWLALDLDREHEDEDAASLAELLRGLADEYPLYDEGDHSELLLDMATEDWREWAREDYRRDFRDALVAEGVDEDDAEQIADDLDLTALAMTLQEDGTVQYEAESATSGVFRGLSEYLQADAARRAETLAAHS